MEFSGEADYTFVRFKDDGDVLSSQDVVDTVQQCLEQHHTSQDPIHFLLLNELAVSYEGSERLVTKLQELLTAMDIQTTIGILGSYHCNKTYFNVSPIVSPFVCESRYELVGAVRKQTSARKQHENIRTPDGTHFVRYETPYGIIMIWICLDMYDPNLVIKLLRANYRLSIGRKKAQREVVDILFLPSYNADLKQNVLNIAKLISKYCRMTVIVCNDSVNLPTKGWNDSVCFHFGVPLEADQATATDKSKVSLFRIPNWNNRRAERSRPFTDDFSSAFTQIFGGQDSSTIPI